MCGRKWFFIVLLIGLVSINGVFARGNREVPAAELATSGTQYISPNDDGVQEEASITFKVTVYVKSEEGYVPEYGISLTDASGNIVRQVVVREESDVGWFMRLFRTFQAFTLEKTIDWDGRDSDGSPAPDGVYTASMWIVAGSDRRTDLELDDFVVDNTAPSATTVDPEPLIFSPNGDGNLDDLTIVQSDGSTEDLWKGQFVDQSGTVVRTYTWEDSGPETFAWEGNDDSGAVAADGIYKFTLTSTDRAGNTFYYAIDDIELNAMETPVAIELDRLFISPNGDGVKDTVTIELSAEVMEDIVSWEAVVYDDAADPVRTYGGQTEPPARVVFDGLDDGENPVGEGDFRAVFRLWYRNGNNPNAAASFHIDTTPPVVTEASRQLPRRSRPVTVPRSSPMRPTP